MKFGGKSCTVVGVVKDMLTNSPYDPIDPAIFLGDGSMSVITIRMKAGLPLHTSMAALKRFLKNIIRPVLLSMFLTMMPMRKNLLKRIASGICLPYSPAWQYLYPVSVYSDLHHLLQSSVQKKSACAKCCGANLFSLWGMLSVQFVKLVLISLCIAIPLSYYGMNNWLQNYSYRDNIPWWVFGIAGLSILLITLLTVSYQSLKAAMMNPVTSLRAE